MRYIGIDPSTKTGFVALDENGQVLRAKELTGIGNKDPKRMITLIDDVIAHIQKDDFIVIEGFGFSTTQGIMLGGIGWGIRMALARRGIKYIEAAPAAVKKFATGKGNTKKENMILPLFQKWGFEHSSDNVRDAFVLAKIAENLYLRQTGFIESNKIKYQEEVIQTIMNPPVKRKKVKK